MCVVLWVRVCDQVEFMRGLMILVTNKMQLDITQLLTSDVLFAHFIDETLAFHRELDSVYSYPASLHSCLHILIQPEPFHKWKTIEKKCEQNESDLNSLAKVSHWHCLMLSVSFLLQNCVDVYQARAEIFTAVFHT